MFRSSVLLLFLRVFDDVKKICISQLTVRQVITWRILTPSYYRPEFTKSAFPTFFDSPDVGFTFPVRHNSRVFLCLTIVPTTRLGRSFQIRLCYLSTYGVACYMHSLYKRNCKEIRNLTGRWNGWLNKLSIQVRIPLRRSEFFLSDIDTYAIRRWNLNALSNIITFIIYYALSFFIFSFI